MIRKITFALLVIAVSGCTAKHELTACSGPYSSMPPPVPVPVVEPPKAAPMLIKPPAKQQVTINQQGL